MLLVLAAALLVSSGAAPAVAVDGYRMAANEQLHPGVTWTQLRTDDPLVLDIAKVHPDAPVKLVPVISGGELYDDPPQPRHATTTAMCESVGGVACVNGDYWICPSCGPPGGGVVVDGVPLRTPTGLHPQVTVLDDGRFVTDDLHVSVLLEAVFHPDEPGVTDVLEEPEPPRTEIVPIREINRPVRDGIVLYSPAWADKTQRGDETVEAVFSGAVPPIGSDAPATLLDIGGNDRGIPDDGYVVVATGSARDGFAERVRSLADADELRLKVAANLPASMSTGGHPVILRDGEPVDLDQSDPKVRNRHPRTIIGWNDAGELWLVTIDGRQAGHSVGVTLAEAADHLRRLGATDAMNLDGGGSSTFVTHAACPDGRSPCVRNRPSDGRERNLSTALALVPTNGTALRSVSAPTPVAPPPPPTTAPPTTAPPPPPPTTAPPTTAPPPPPTTTTTIAPTTTTTIAPTTAPPTTVAPTTTSPEVAIGPRAPMDDDRPAHTGPAAVATGALGLVGFLTMQQWRRGGVRLTDLFRP